MIWEDLRSYLDRLEKLGELRRVAGANWEEEIGGITELIAERRGPALLFDQIPGYPTGYRVAANLFNTPQRIGLALGLGAQSSFFNLAQRWQEAIQNLDRIAPVEVSWGPILENVLEGDGLDLYKFPTPKWHENDGGRYIGTGLCVIQRDPDSGFINVGAYRAAIHDRRTCTLFIEHGKHGDRIRRKHWSRGEKCPVVVSFGQEPILTALAGSGVYHSPEGISELEVAGYFQRAPYRVVKGAHTGLPIPATAEIALEGFIPSPQEAMAPEGPFGEWTGYYAHGRRPETVIQVKAIYHRNEPILLGSPPSRPIGGQNSASLGGEESATKAKLEVAGIPGIRRVYSLARPYFRVVSLKQMHAEHVNDVIRLLVPGGDQYNGHHIWVIVDEDIEPSNAAEVLWAIASRCAPESGVQVIPGTGVWQLDPRIHPEDRSSPEQGKGRRPYIAHNLVINACRPYDWIGDFPPVCVNSPELRQKMMEKWRELFS